MWEKGQGLNPEEHLCLRDSQKNTLTGSCRGASREVGSKQESVMSQESRGEGVVGRAEHCLEVRENAGGEASVRLSTKEGTGDLNESGLSCGQRWKTVTVG